MATVTYYTLDETAELLRVHPQTVRRWIREQRLPAQRFGKQYRLRPEDIERAATTAGSHRGRAAPREPTAEDEGDEFDCLALAGLHDVWDNDEDSVYDNWRELYGVPPG